MPIYVRIFCYVVKLCTMCMKTVEFLFYVLLELIVALLMWDIKIVLTFGCTFHKKKHLFSYLDACWVV